MSKPDNNLYEFGAFRLDPPQRLLLRGEEHVHLPPMVFDLLLFLVQRSGQLVKKEEIINHLWPNTNVEEGNLTNNISILRKELGDTEKYIETIPKHGYRFVANVRVVHAVGAAHIPETPQAQVYPRKRQRFYCSRQVFWC